MISRGDNPGKLGFTTQAGLTQSFILRDTLTMAGRLPGGRLLLVRAFRSPAALNTGQLADSELCSEGGISNRSNDNVIKSMCAVERDTGVSECPRATPDVPPGDAASGNSTVLALMQGLAPCGGATEREF